MKLLSASTLISAAFLVSCQPSSRPAEQASPAGDARLQPRYVSDSVRYDTDDPAIWVNPADPARSMVLGTDKDSEGALYVFDLQGKVVEGKIVRGLKYPNNVDVEYGFLLGGERIDIVVLTERERSMLRIFRLPELTPIDGGGIPVFEGETGEDFRAPMGVSLYKRRADSAIFAVLSRKFGPEQGYLWQYRLLDDGQGQVQAQVVRKFGAFSGRAEIESIAVDDGPGYVYYSDETAGVRQYFADPDRGDAELAFFATEGFAEDHEGISIYPTGDTTGYILVSDQQANRFQVFEREGRLHRRLALLPFSTEESDGSEICPLALGADFPQGLFVAMSSDRTFQYYRWEDIAKQIPAQP
jgi:3-phytase